MLRIGSIGAGRRGRVCRLAHRPEQGVILAAICDPKPQVREEYRREFGPDLCIADDYRKLLDENELDAVFVTTPDYLHAEHALAALRRGISVYLEKPLAITIEDCDLILRAAAEHGAKLYVGHNMRFFPVMRKMKQIIDSGRIGEVQAVWCRHFVDYGGDAYFKDWHSERRFTTGLLLQKGAHDIDIIHWLAGAHTTRTVGMGKLSVYNRVADRRSPREVNEVEFNPCNWPPLAQTKLSPVIDVEDHSMVLMQLANGVQASYQQCHYTPDGHRNYTVIGTEGRIENCGDYSTPENEAVIRLWTRRVSYNENGTESISIPPAIGTHGGADPLIVDDFIHYLRTGERHGADPLDARAAVAVGVLATQSLRQGNQPYDVPAFEPAEVAAGTAFTAGNSSPCP